MNFKCISEDIKIPLSDLPSNAAGMYTQYSVSVGKTGSSAPPKTVFTGRIYVDNKLKGELYLNDIIKPYMDIISDVTVNFGGVVNKSFTISNIVNCYADTNRNPLKSYRDAGNPSTFDTRLIRTKAIPIVPPYNPSKTQYVGLGSSIISDTSIGQITIEGGSSESTVVDGNGITYNNLNPGSLLKSSGEIYLTRSSTRIPIAITDDCESDFYVTWKDRNGAYFCMPFKKKSAFKESISTTTLFDQADNEHIYRKIVTPKWTLNTDWVDEEYYKACESILVSPEIYVYDSVNDVVNTVICKEANWEEKNKRNTKRLFNFSVTLEASKKQNIIY